MRNLLEIEIGSVCVEGEVTNLRRQASGHVYFSLKDENTQVSCVMFRGNAIKSRVQPEHGDVVHIYGEVSMYEARGNVQIIVRKVEAAGEGELQARYEALKEKLRTEGLFDQERKKEIPKMPTNVGLITSGSGAALEDMLRTVERRAPWVQPYLWPVQVQGKGAEKGIAAAICGWSDWQKNGLPPVDVLIVARGGGSLEDLWNFNEEIVARAIAECSIPVVTGVGHEPDQTIVDYVADYRAATPTAAAEAVTPDGEVLYAKLKRFKRVLRQSVDRKIERSELILTTVQRGMLQQSPERLLREPMLRLAQAGDRLELAAERCMEARVRMLAEFKITLASRQPKEVLSRREAYLAQMNERLERSVSQGIEQRERQMEHLRGVLKVLGPENVLARGYSLTMDAEKRLIMEASQVRRGQKIITKLRDGEFGSTAD